MAVDIQNFEVEEQFLGFSPVNFVDSVINAVNDYCYDGSEEMVSVLVREHKTVDPTVLRQDIEKLLNFTQDAVDKYFDKFELYCLTNVFRVPAHAKLESDLPSEGSAPSKKDEAALTEELAELTRSLPKLKNKQGELKEELVQLDAEQGKVGAEKLWRDAALLTRKKVRADAEHVQFLADSVSTFGTLGQQMYESTKRTAALFEDDEDESRAYQKRRKSGL